MDSERFIVHQSAAEFLDELRKLIWTTFMNRMLERGAKAYGSLTGVFTDRLTMPRGLSADDVYRLKEDACGVPAKVFRGSRDHRIVEHRAVHAGLKINGATHGEQLLSGRQANQNFECPRSTSDQLQSQFQDEPTPFDSADVLICVGAKDDGAMAIDIARGNKNRSTVIRPAIVGEWVTEDQAPQFWRPAANASAYDAEALLITADTRRV
ncbi:MAG: hypothetical protein WKF37_18280 [Bryobacteraceae bacterium]